MVPKLAELVDFFADPPETALRRPILRGQRSGFATQRPGVYVWYASELLADHSCLAIPRGGRWDLGKRLVFYVGEAHVRTICRRIKAESKLRADQSQPQMGFGCLLADHFQLELRRKLRTPQYMDFWPNKDKLFEWMQANVEFAYREIDQDASAIVDIQYELIEHLRPLTNLHRRLDVAHPFEQRYRQLRNQLRQRAAQLPPV